jgi:hypothetical protein
MSLGPGLIYPHPHRALAICLFDGHIKADALGCNNRLDLEGGLRACRPIAYYPLQALFERIAGFGKVFTYLVLNLKYLFFERW